MPCASTQARHTTSAVWGGPRTHHNNNRHQLTTTTGISSHDAGVRVRRGCGRARLCLRPTRRRTTSVRVQTCCALRACCASACMPLPRRLLDDEAPLLLVRSTSTKTTESVNCRQAGNASETCFECHDGVDNDADGAHPNLHRARARVAFRAQSDSHAACKQASWIATTQTVLPTQSVATGRPEAHQLAAVAVAARDDHVCESIGLGGKTLWQLCGVSWSRSAVQDGSHRCVAVHTFWSRSVVQDWRHRGMGVRLCGDVDAWMCGGAPVWTEGGDDAPRRCSPCSSSADARNQHARCAYDRL